MSRHSSELSIGRLARNTATNVATIRYYEEIGLLPPAERRSSGHRVYDDASQELLSFIRRCRAFGFSIEQVRMLVALTTQNERDCVEARDVAQAHLESVRTKASELRLLEQSLVAFIASCNAACAGGPGQECTILKDLGHGQARATPGSSCCS